MSELCLAIHGKIISVKGENAVVDYGSEKRTARNIIGAKAGDFVIVQQKMVVERIDAKHAAAMQELLQ